ncbi:hypothetical protein QN277_023660 [Acacia crassicarpa]|uniref:60S ribosomal protein L12 n=1 Tax=Acacia crassicarpa TaxID=499986 RepID=A0AAE1MN88_9FABA|nr:hypothetical protein QN277_023660 [Acacia crassicarpa]
MPPKLDPCQVVHSFVRVTSSEVGVQPAIGPLDLSPKKIGEDIAKETAKDWKGLRVTVKLTVQNRQAKVSVVIEISRTMRPRSMAKDFSGTLKEILRTCVSVGCTVDGEDPEELQQEIIEGDVEIDLILVIQIELMLFWHFYSFFWKENFKFS